MADTSIEWTEKTWNPIVGCSVISPGCTNCYAMRMAGRLERMGSPIYRGLTRRTKAGDVWAGHAEKSNWGQVIAPLSWRKPRMVFVNSMSDLFHESLPDETIDLVFAVMAVARQHTYQVLTKRADRMRAYCETVLHESDQATAPRVARALNMLGVPTPEDGFPWPLPNVWFGASVEDQARANQRIPDLLATPAAVRFLSCEPLLGPVDLGAPVRAAALAGQIARDAGTHPISWVIAGAESGPDARPCDLDWVRSLRDQCQDAGVAFFFKQHAKNGRKIPLPDLDGRQWREMPGQAEPAGLGVGDG